MALGLPDLAAWTPADFGAASSVGTLLVAITATWIARRQLIQARQLREEEAAPAVVVDVVPSPVSGHILDLVIENIGKTAARDVRITSHPPVKSATNMAGYELADWSAIKDGIKTLVPGRRLTALFDSAVERFDSDLPRQFEVTVESRDSHGRPQRAMTHTVDLEPIFGALHTDIRGMHHLVKEVEKLRKAVEPITKKSLTVEVYDGPTRDGQRAEAREQHQARARAFEERQAVAQVAAAAEEAPLGGNGDPPSA